MSSRSAYRSLSMRNVDCDTSTAPATLPWFGMGIALYRVSDCCPAVTRVAAPYCPTRASWISWPFSTFAPA